MIAPTRAIEVALGNRLRRWREPSVEADFPSGAEARITAYEGHCSIELHGVPLAQCLEIINLLRRDTK